MTRFAKFYAASAGTVALAVTLLQDGDLSTQDAVALGASLFAAAGVFFVSNSTPTDARHPSNRR